jgi:hypothetical protein
MGCKMNSSVARIMHLFFALMEQFLVWELDVPRDLISFPAPVYFAFVNICL